MLFMNTTGTASILYLISDSTFTLINYSKKFCGWCNAEYYIKRVIFSLHSKIWILLLQFNVSPYLDYLIFTVREDN